jgi:hypothetical protein
VVGIGAAAAEPQDHHADRPGRGLLRHAPQLYARRQRLHRHEPVPRSAV